MNNNDCKVEIIKPNSKGLFCNYIYKSIPLAFDESLSYYECLCGLLSYLKETVVPTVNNNAEKLAKLEEYVVHYFDNLDVQTEINNKLDQMAQSGELEEIVASYLNVNSQLCYNTLQDLKNASNLVNGSFVKTYGYYILNDGGGAIYKIRNVTNSDIADNMTLIALNDTSLVAEYINYKSYINPLEFGAKKDGVTDSYNQIQKAINLNNVIMTNGSYLISDTINVPSIRNFDGNKAVLIPSSNKFAIKCVGLNINQPITETTIKNFRINTSNGGNGILIDKGYFIYIDDINIIQLKENDAVGIKQIDSFNIIITNSRVFGDPSYTNQIGLQIITDNEPSINNITNCKYDSLLLQNLTYGVKMTCNNTSNMNEFNNLGFSNDNYAYYVEGYNLPVVFNNSRMEAGSKLDAGETLYGFYLKGTIMATINSFNAYNIQAVIHNESNNYLCLDGSIALTGTQHSSKFYLIEKSNASIINKANIYYLSNVYSAIKSDWNADAPTAILSNPNLIPGGDVTTQNLQTSNYYTTIHKATVSILNVFGLKGSRVIIWTDQPNLVIYGKANSTTNKWDGSVSLIPYKMYSLYAIEVNQFIIED